MPISILITFLVKIYYIYGEPDYYIYGYNFTTFMVINLLHYWLVFITFMGDTPTARLEWVLAVLYINNILNCQGIPIIL